MDPRVTGATALRYGQLFRGDAHERMANVQRRSESLRNALRDIRQRADLFANATQVSLELIEPLSGSARALYRIDALEAERGAIDLPNSLADKQKIDLFEGGSDWNSAKKITCEVADAAERRVLGASGLEKHVYRLRRRPPSSKPRDALFKLQNTPVASDVPLLNLFSPPVASDWPAVNHSSEGIEWCVLRDAERDGCASQREFVQLLLDSPDFSLLDGPPGSGKTTVITEAVVQAVRRGRRVLLCAPTHVAVDNVLERLSETDLIDNEGILAVRIESGAYTAPRSVKRFVEGELAETFRTSVSSHLETIPETEWSESQRSLRNLVSASDSRLHDLLIRAANLVCGTTLGVINGRVFDESNDRDETNFFDHLVIDEASKVTLPEMLVPAIRAHRWSLIGDVRQLSPVGAQDAESILAGAMNRALGSNDSHSAHALGALADAVRRKRARGQDGESDLGNFDAPEVSIDRWAGQLGWRLETLYGLRQSPAEDADRERLEAEVEALCRTGDTRIDLAIEAACQLVSGVCIGSVLEALQSGIGVRRPDQRSVISEGFPDSVLKARQVHLTHQHRMHPEISRFPRENFYGGELLLDAKENKGRPWGGTRYGSRSVWLSVRSDEGDRAARVVIDELEALIGDPSWLHQIEVAILFFYRDQVRQFRSILRAKYPEAGDDDLFSFDRGRVGLRVETVDNFQGREADVVYLVLGSKGETPFTKSPNRVNVALTRARHQLVIVGDHAQITSRWSGPLARLASDMPMAYSL